MRRLLLVLFVLLASADAAAQSVILSQYPPGRAAAAASLSMTLSTEDQTVLNSLDTKLTNISGYIDGLEALIGTTNTTLSSVLTTSVFNSAFGVAGTADTQVLSVQGIASMTPLTITDGAGAMNVIIDSSAMLTVNAHAVTNAGTFVVQENGAALTAFQIMDDWDESDRAKVNLIVGQVGVAAGTGVNGSTVLRVTLATDDLAAVDIGAIRMATESAASSLDSIESNLSPDAIDGNTAIATGPQGMLEYNSARAAVTTTQSIRAQGSSKGEAYGVIRDAAGNGRGANVNASNELTVSASGTLTATGPAAHDAAVSGNPLLGGLEARKTLGTAVSASGDVVRATGDPYGRQYVLGPLLAHTGSNGTGVTSTTTGVIAAPSAGSHLRIYRLHVINSSATPCVIRWRDGAAGQQHYPAYLPQGGIASVYIDGGWDLTTATRLDLVLSAGCTAEYTIAHETVVD